MAGGIAGGEGLCSRSAAPEDKGDAEKGPAKSGAGGCCRLFLCNLFRFFGGFSFCLFRRIGFFAVVVVAEVFDV